jgi:hypothetical protein
LAGETQPEEHSGLGEETFREERGLKQGNEDITYHYRVVALLFREERGFRRNGLHGQFTDSTKKPSLIQVFQTDQLITNQVFLSRPRKFNVMRPSPLTADRLLPKRLAQPCGIFFLDFMVSFINQLTTLLQIRPLNVIRKANGRY